MEDDFEEIKQEEKFKDCIAQYEIATVFNFIEAFKKEKKMSNNNNKEKQLFDLMSLYQFKLYDNSENPIKIPEPEFIPSTDASVNYKLENEMQ